MSSRVKRIAVLMAGFSLLVAACGSASDKAAEKLAEELIEASSGGDVNVDISGDGDDVTFEMETEEGSFSMGSGGDLPEGLEVPVPDGGDVVTTFAAEDGIMATLTYEGDRYDEIVSFYDDWTDGAGGDWNKQTFSMDSGEGTVRNTIWAQDSDEKEQAITVSDCPGMGSDSSDADAVCVTVTQGM